MIPLHQARTLALASVSPLKTTRMPLLEAHGLFLADPVVASRPSPALDNAAMDGFAVQSADTVGANRNRPAALRVVGTLFAGSAPPERDLESGEAFRIFTGAPIPFGADAVVRLEASRDDGELVAVFAEAHAGENIRRRGEEYREGTVLCPPARRLDAFSLGVIAAAGSGSVTVRDRPRVAVLTVGDELVAPGKVAQRHQVYDAGGVLLAALSAEANARVLAVEHARDIETELAAAIERLASSSDLLVTTGGASVGERDLVKKTVRNMGGTLGFDGVALKPGKPASVAMLHRTPIAILPGNPGAATVAFDQLARPMLLKLQGVIEQRRRERARIDGLKKKQHALTYLIGARLERKGAELTAKLRPHGAGQLLGNVGIDGWAVLPAGKAELAAGEEVEVELFASPEAHHVPPRDASEEVTR